MAIAEEIIKKIAGDTGVNVDELTTAGLLAFLREKKRKVIVDRLEVLGRYNATSTEELEKKIKDGEVTEHPAWEDLILLENLEATIATIGEDIRAIQGSS